jgi:hypothetical protein
VITLPSMPSWPAIAAAVTRVIAGDHPDPDARRLGRRDRGLGGGARRVHDPDQSQHLQAAHQRQQVGAGIEGRRVEVLARGGQHPQALLPQPLVLGQVALPEVAVGRHRPGVGVEGELGEARVRLPGRGGLHGALGCERDQRALGWVADQVAVAEHRIRGQHHRQQELVERDLLLPPTRVICPAVE